MLFIRRAWAWLGHHPGHLIWVVLAYFPFLGAMSIPLTGDQKVYLSTALEMRQAGSWLRPMLFGESSYYKPPLQYWATLLGWKVFGFNLWGALIPSALCVVVTAWLIGEIGGLLYGKRAFSIAGLWFAAALGTATYGATAQMEIYVVLFYSAGWWAGLRFITSGAGEASRNFVWLFLAFAIAGLSALVKSPLYSVLWVSGFLTYLVISGEWGTFRDKRFYQAWFFGVLLGSAWFVAVWVADGQRFWSDYVLREQLSKAPNGGGPLSLWGALLYFCVPFTLLIFPAMRVVWKRRRTELVKRFMLSWAWAPALFFTAYTYRIKPYLYPLLPVLALGVDLGYILERRGRGFRTAIVASGVILFVAGGMIALVLRRAELTPVWIQVGFVAVGGFALLCSLKDWIRELAYCGLAGIFFYHAASVSLGEADIAGLRAAVQARGAHGVAMWDESRNIWHEVGLLSAALGVPVQRLANEDQIADFLQAGGVVALSEEQFEGNERTFQAKLMGRGDLRDLQSLPWTRFRARAKFPFRELILHGPKSVPDFQAGLHREFKIVYLEKPS